MSYRKRKAVCLCLLIVFAGALQIDTGGVLGLSTFHARTPTPLEEAPVAQLTKSETAFLQKQYATAVAEIQRRIEQECLLFGFKFSLVGAILAFLFTVFLKGTKSSDSGYFIKIFPSTPIAACICWAAVVTSAVIDCRIEFHSNMMITLGTWIREYVEPFLLPDQRGGFRSPVGWEAYLSQGSDLSKTRLYPLLRLNANLLTLMLFSATTLFFSGCLGENRQDKNSILTSRFCLFGCLFAILVFLLVSLQFSFRDKASLAISLGLSLGAAVCTFLVWNHFPAEDEGKRQDD